MATSCEEEHSVRLGEALPPTAAQRPAVRPRMRSTSSGSGRLLLAHQDADHCRVNVSTWMDSALKSMQAEPTLPMADAFHEFATGAESRQFITGTYFYLLAYKRVCSAARHVPAPVPPNSKPTPSSTSSTFEKPSDAQILDLWKRNAKLRADLQQALGTMARRYALLLLRYARHESQAEANQFFGLLVDFVERCLRAGFASEPAILPMLNRELRRVLFTDQFDGSFTASRRHHSQHVNKASKAMPAATTKHARQRIRDVLSKCSPLVSSMLPRVSVHDMVRQRQRFIYGLPGIPVKSSRPGQAGNAGNMDQTSNGGTTARRWTPLETPRSERTSARTSMASIPIALSDILEQEYTSDYPL